jgi:hypothetical protein
MREEVQQGGTPTHGLEAAALLGLVALEVASLAVGTPLLLGNEGGITVGIVRVGIAEEVSKVEVDGGGSALLGVGVDIMVAVAVAVGVVGEQRPGNVDLVL